MDIYLYRHVLDPKQHLPPQCEKMLMLGDLYSRFDGLSGHQSGQSLDQSYYTALQVEDLRKRDEDQVVLKWYKKNQLRSRKTEGIRSSVQDDDWRPVDSRSEALQPNKRGQLPKKETTQRETSPDSVSEQAESEALRGKIERLRAGKDEDDGKLLMIHQLWLWKLNDSEMTATDIFLPATAQSY